MKIILSRKGFDSGSGGCASPIIDGRIISFPIPGQSSVRYEDILTLGQYGNIVEDLTRGRVSRRCSVHHDPDIDHGTLKRLEGWRPSFGQSGAAQSHLISNNVSVGDVFLFFGWFKDVHRVCGEWAFQKGGRSVHAIFGWLQVGEILVLRNGDDGDWNRHPWLKGHPHLNRGPDDRNVIYIASDELTLPDIGKTGLRGGGTVKELTEMNTLTSPTAKSKSNWRLPSWFYDDEKPKLSYHSAPDRWQVDGDHVHLSSVARGQEFVLDCFDRPQASEWVLELLASSHCLMQSKAA